MSGSPTGGSPGSGSSLTPRLRRVVCSLCGRDLLSLGGRWGVVKPLWWTYGIKEVRDTDVFVVSYPRSGNTWIRFILAYLDRGVGASLGYDEVGAIVPDAHLGAEPINAMTGRRIIKIHHPFLDACPRIVYAHRDPRESLVSYWYYLQRRARTRGSFSQFLRGPLPSQYGSWKEHMRACRRRLSTRPESILVLRYQDLREDFLTTVGRLATWTRLGSGVDLEELRRRTTMDTMAGEERAKGSAFNAMTGKYFFDDSGEGLRWRDHWSREDLDWLARDRELVSLMEEFGYR